jgi:fatty-acyl-CoA synthase
MMESFDAEGALATIEKHQVTHSQWVPTMFIRMLKLPQKIRDRYDLSSLRVAIHAAAPCPVEVKRAMINWWGPVLYEYYGATEGYGISFIDSQEWLAHPGSVGRDGVAGIAHVVGDDGSELPTGDTGVIYFEREQMPFQYLNDPEKTAAARHPDHPNWATVGDVGYIDKDRFLYLTDRRSHMIISGGVNIYPREIEDVLALHPAVFDVAVIGVPDEEMGESVKALVQLAEDVTWSPQVERGLMELCRTQLAGFKCPRSIEAVASLPRTPTGKLLKHALLRQYRSQPTWS